MNHLAEEGYLRFTRSARATALRLVSALRETPGLRVLGDPQATLVAFTGDGGVDAFAVGQRLASRGWMLDRQGPPPSLHATVNAVHETVLEAFIAELRQAVIFAREAGAAGLTAAYGTVE
jgi:glutamate/tyrosine decarboxylase-like PLP-dependent enzyme